MSSPPNVGLGQAGAKAIDREGTQSADRNYDTLQLDISCSIYKSAVEFSAQEIPQDGGNPHPIVSQVSDGTIYWQRRTCFEFTITDLSSDGGAPSSTSKGGDT